MQAIRTTGLLAAFLLPWQLATAQGVPVVEAGSDTGQGQASQPPPPSGNGQNEIMVNMYLQLEALQNEVQNLRGQVEEQAYEIRRMQSEQRDRYLDIDSRLVEIRNQVQGGGQPSTIAPTRPGPAGQAGPGAQAVTGVDTPGDNAAGREDGNPADAATIPRSEQEIYRQALALLLEQEEYEDSIALFQQYIDVYPQGRYFTNSLYWQGAALELAGNYNRAIEVLMRLINNYPQDPKAPTAMLRLGKVYREMGRTADAIAMWQQISELYPDSTSEIELASEYLSDAGTP